MSAFWSGKHQRHFCFWHHFCTPFLLWLGGAPARLRTTFNVYFSLFLHVLRPPPASTEFPSCQHDAHSHAPFQGRTFARTPTTCARTRITRAHTHGHHHPQHAAHMQLNHTPSQAHRQRHTHNTYTAFFLLTSKTRCHSEQQHNKKQCSNNTQSKQRCAY